MWTSPIPKRRRVDASARPRRPRGRCRLLAALLVTILAAGCASTPTLPPESPSPGISLPLVSGPTQPAPPIPGPPAPPAPPVVSGPAARLPVTVLDRIEYYSAIDYFAAYGLRLTPGKASAQWIFQGGGHLLELDAGQRSATLDGLKVYLGEPTETQKRTLLVSRIDAERLLGPILSPASIAAPRPPGLHVIVLDPGHGGKDSGTTNKGLNLMEKTFTLAVAKRLQPLLQARGYEVLLTRTDDTFVELGDRPAFANRAHADLFISIHFNSAAPDTKTTGTEAFWFAPQSQRSTAGWSPGKKDDSLPNASPVNRFDPWSAVLANALHGSVLTALGTVDRGQKTAHLAVLRGLDCPGALVESAFLSNDAEARRIASPEFQQKVAEGLAAGVDAYAKLLGPPRK
jgi:N-acetylmuramoyl-L-alanine amidase